MTDDTATPPKSPARASRDDRLGEQLRANLQRRKAQTRARRTGAADQRPEGIDPGGSDPDKSASDQ